MSFYCGPTFMKQVKFKIDEERAARLKELEELEKEMPELISKGNEKFVDSLYLNEDGFISPEEVLKALTLGKLRFNKKESEQVMRQFEVNDEIEKKAFADILKHFYE